MYTYDGGNHDLKLNCFRIDSPMKGQLSAASSAPTTGAADATPDTLLSFDLATVNTTTWQMTVREVRYYPTVAFSSDTSTLNPDTGLNSTFAATNVPMETVPLVVAAPTFSVPTGTYSSTQLRHPHHHHLLHCRRHDPDHQLAGLLRAADHQRDDHGEYVGRNQHLREHGCQHCDRDLYHQRSSDHLDRYGDRNKRHRDGRNHHRCDRRLLSPFVLERR